MAVKESSASKIKFKGVDALFGLSEEQECVREIPLDELDTFKNLWISASASYSK